MHKTLTCHFRKDLCCLWKLLGDCCILVQSLEASIVHVSVPSVLLGKESGGESIARKSKVFFLINL